MSAHTAKFERNERLSGALRIREVALSGSSVHEHPFRLTGKLMDLATPSPLQVAFAVPKRGLPRAVDRNTMRRRMREVFRLNKTARLERLRKTQRQCAWLFVYQGSACISYRETELKITRAMDRWLQQHVLPAE